MSNQETTTNEIMEFLQENMVTKEDLQNELRDGLDGLAATLRKEMRIMEHRIMDAMDVKLANLKGDLIAFMRKADKKFCTLVGVLSKKKVITPKETGQILEMQPFPKIK